MLKARETASETKTKTFILHESHTARDKPKDKEHAYIKAPIGLMRHLYVHKNFYKGPEKPTVLPGYLAQTYDIN